VSRHRDLLRLRLPARESYVVSWLMLAMVILPWLALVWPPVARQLEVWWVDVAVHVALMLIAALGVGAILRRQPKFTDAVTPRAYAHACLRLGMLWVACGFLVLIFGRTPSKIAHYRVPRAESVRWFAIGGVLAVIAVVVEWFAERRQR